MDVRAGARVWVADGSSVGFGGSRDHAQGRGEGAGVARGVSRALDLGGCWARLVYPEGATPRHMDALMMVPLRGGVGGVPAQARPLDWRDEITLVTSPTVRLSHRGRHNERSLAAQDYFRPGSSAALCPGGKETLSRDR